jgi:hypothetical protein
VRHIFIVQRTARQNHHIILHQEFEQQLRRGARARDALQTLSKVSTLVQVFKNKQPKKNSRNISLFFSWSKCFSFLG